MDQQQSGMGRTALLIGLGLLVGAVAALLFAPGGGDKTRRMITDAMEEGYNRSRKATNEVLSQLENEYPNLKDRVDSMLSSIKP